MSTGAEYARARRLEILSVQFPNGRHNCELRSRSHEGVEEHAAGSLASVRHTLDSDCDRVQGSSEAELRAKLAADPADHETRLALAAFYAGHRKYAQAMEELLEIVRRAKGWRDGEARKQLVTLFNLAASQPELVAEYRRKLASTLH
jgi:thioredoxin-like negative regulator of GroEL